MEITKIVLFLFVWMEWSVRVECGASVRERADKQMPKKWHLLASNIKQMDNDDRRQQIKKETEVQFQTPCQARSGILLIKNFFAETYNKNCISTTPFQIENEWCDTENLQGIPVHVIHNKQYEVCASEEHLYCATRKQNIQVECKVSFYKREYAYVEKTECSCLMRRN